MPPFQLAGQTGTPGPQGIYCQCARGTAAAVRGARAPSRTTELKPLSVSTASAFDATSVFDAITTSNIGTNQVYSDFMARRTACDLIIVFKPAASALASRTLQMIALPMATACSSVNDEESSPATPVGTGVEGIGVVPS